MIKTLDDLKSLLDLIEKRGITHIRLGDVELTLKPIEVDFSLDLPEVTDEELLMNPYAGLKE